MKISELKVKRKTTREKRDASGRIVREQVDIQVKRKVNTIHGGKRFGHYAIDVAIIVGISYLLIYLGVIEPVRNVTYSGGGFRVEYSLNLGSFVLFFGYYLLSEGLMGRTIGKMATHSYVIDEYAKKPDFGTIFIRTIFRLIPFEAFSCLGERGWHDTWSKTYVVSKTEWDELKRALNGDELSDSDQILD